MLPQLRLANDAIVQLVRRRSVEIFSTTIRLKEDTCHSNTVRSALKTHHLRDLRQSTSGGEETRHRFKK